MTTAASPPSTTPPVTPANPYGWAGVAAALLALISSFLPWASVPTLFGTIDIAGTRGDGKITAVLALIAGAYLFAAISSQNTTAATSAGVVGALGVVMSVFEITNLSNRVGSAASEFATVEVGVGLYLCVIGFVAVMACAFTTRAKFSPRTRQPFRPVWPEPSH